MPLFKRKEKRYMVEIPVKPKVVKALTKLLREGVMKATKKDYYLYSEAYVGAEVNVGAVVIVSAKSERTAIKAAIKKMNLKRKYLEVRDVRRIS